jgi:hypothetical protein
MTRLFLEIKNNVLCAEPSSFILLYFLCKNLLFLCAEHYYPKSTLHGHHAYEAACALAAGSDRSDAFDLGRGPESLLALWQQADGANDLLV